jgi:hypothetical protein
MTATRPAVRTATPALDPNRCQAVTAKGKQCSRAKLMGVGGPVADYCSHHHMRGWGRTR